MKCLITGRNRSGSWQIRGEQLGAAVQATSELRATKLKGYDLAIIVKRPPSEVLPRLHSLGIPIVWDIVDAWPQPDGNSWGKDTCLKWLRDEIKAIKPTGIVAATQQMLTDCIELNLNIPLLYLPHHVRPGQEINPIRLKVQNVGYEGGDRYLGHWRDWLEQECEARGWHFVMNPASLAELDVVVAFRHLNGYASVNWKSNVKLANAQGSGTPCILNREAGYTETSCGGETWANTLQELRDAMDALIPVQVRKERSHLLRQAAIPLQLEEVAKRYKTWLQQLKF